MSLHPTKTRLDLLEAVGAGDVLQVPDGDELLLATFDTTDAEIGVRARRVTARIGELEREGWVRLRVDHMTWELTSAGLAVLDRAMGAA